MPENASSVLSANRAALCWGAGEGLETTVQRGLPTSAPQQKAPAGGTGHGATRLSRLQNPHYVGSSVFCETGLSMLVLRMPRPLRQGIGVLCSNPALHVDILINAVRCTGIVLSRRGTAGVTGACVTGPRFRASGFLMLLPAQSVE